MNVRSGTKTNYEVQPYNIQIKPRLSEYFDNMNKTEKETILSEFDQGNL